MWIDIGNSNHSGMKLGKKVGGFGVTFLYVYKVSVPTYL